MYASDIASRESLLFDRLRRAAQLIQQPLPRSFGMYLEMWSDWGFEKKMYYNERVGPDRKNVHVVYRETMCVCDTSRYGPNVIYRNVFLQTHFYPICQSYETVNFIYLELFLLYLFMRILCIHIACICYICILWIYLWYAKHHNVFIFGIHFWIYFYEFIFSICRSHENREFLLTRMISVTYFNAHIIIVFLLHILSL